MNAHHVSVAAQPRHIAEARGAEHLSWPLNGVGQWQVGRPGWLAVEGASVWLTRDGELDDHVLAPGQGMALRSGDRITVEPWCAGARARLVWSPAATAQRDGVLRAAGLARTAASAWRRALAG